MFNLGFKLIKPHELHVQEATVHVQEHSVDLSQLLEQETKAPLQEQSPTITSKFLL